MEEIGGAAANAAVSGNVHFVAEDDAHAMELTRQLLSYLPLNNASDPPHRPTTEISLEPDKVLDDLAPEDPRAALDMDAVIARVIDAGTFLEVHREFATNLIVGFGRIDGVVVGLIANRPRSEGGDARHRCFGQGCRVHPVLQRVQSADPDVG